MRRGRTLFWAIIGSIVAAAAVVIALILANSGTPLKAASSPALSISASASPPASESAPVVIPKTSGASSFSYLSDMAPSGKLGELDQRAGQRHHGVDRLHAGLRQARSGRRADRHHDVDDRAGR